MLEKYLTTKKRSEKAGEICCLLVSLKGDPCALLLLICFCSSINEAVPILE